MIILYRRDPVLVETDGSAFWDYYICRGARTAQYREPSESYWMVPGTFDPDV